MKRKFAQGSIVADGSLGERQIRVIASDSSVDRTNDIMVPEGCVLTNYRNNPIVLADHDSTRPIGTAVPVIRNGRVEAVIDFAPKGISAKADEYCGLAKAGIIRAVSVGFDPLEFEPIQGGGYKYNKWELMELSVVAVPANPNALIVGRSAGKAGRVLSAANASMLRDAHDHSEKCRGLIAGVLSSADDQGDESDDCPDDDCPDEELSARARRRRQFEVMRARGRILNDEIDATLKGPAGDAAARQHRLREVETRQRGGAPTLSPKYNRSLLADRQAECRELARRSGNSEEQIAAIQRQQDAARKLQGWAR
jgi:HK97 family phage prohead protease